MSEKSLELMKLNRTRRRQYTAAAESIAELVTANLPKGRRTAILEEVASGGADFELLMRFGARGEAVVVALKRPGQPPEILDRLVSPPEETPAAKPWLN